AGSRFVLDLWLNAESVPALAQQSYLTFTNSLLQNANMSSIDTSCVLTNTLTGDRTTFDTVVQNQVCNGPGQCNFNGLITDPGSIAFVSDGYGVGGLCPHGCGGVFRVARIGLCATAPGQ